MNFITVSVKCPVELIDVIIAELFEIGFDSFQEFDDGFEGSIEEDSFVRKSLALVVESYPNSTFEIKEQEKVNWNEEWEKNYDPIVVENRCLVRATFHESDPSFEYEIILNPKMSFGTGHHATTYQVLAYQMELDHEGKKVLDVGSGTGILSIMAHKRGAASITATDLDDWCIENSTENFSLNDVKNVKVIQGQIEKVEEGVYDIVIANINKNVLLDQLKSYSQRLKDGGIVLLSGFYTEDVDDLLAEARKHSLSKIGQTSKENWAMLALSKPLV